jgi:SAM-dependent methyltransferase
MAEQAAGTAGYGEQANALIAQYESVGFEDVQRDVLHLFPQQPSRILDIGAGSGRDAGALAQRGHTVVAVEPTRELREDGQRRYCLPNLQWLDDHLPLLQATRKRDQGFDLILLTAVWMHLQVAERHSAMQVISGLLLPAGRVIMSLRHGPVPPGRQMFDVSAAETIELATAFGLHCTYQGEREDMFDRAGVRWSLLALDKR